MSWKTLGWQLQEIVNLKDQGVPFLELLQLYKFAGKKKDDTENLLWFVLPTLSPLKADAFVANLLQKALMKGSFLPEVDVYVTPLIGQKEKFSYKDENGGCLYHGFPTASSRKNPTSPDLNVFHKTLMRWGSILQPKCLITFTLGKPMIRYNELPHNVVDKLADLSERPLYTFGSEPEDIDELTSLSYKQQTAESFGQWCIEQDIHWIDFTLDADKKNFEEVAATEWKSFVGPCLKWLIEGARFQPVVEDDPLKDIEVIPALEMPAEFANL
jgi:hypothetical protein